MRSPEALALLVGLGVALRLWAYAGNASFWLDEILLARNIVGLPLGELVTRPLRLDQVAPRGFLLVEKLAALGLGGSELALRLFPFLCAVAGVFLFRRLAERALEGVAVPFALALFALGIPLIKQAAEVKQYALDVTGAILLTLLALDLVARDRSAARLLAAGLAGFAMSWFSQASVLVMGGIGLALAARWCLRRDRRTGRVLLLVVPLWAAGSAIAVWVGLRTMTPATQEFMHDFWRPGFAPLPLASAATLRWLWDEARSAFADPTLLRYPWPGLFVGVGLLGFADLCRRRRDVALLLAGPVVVALVAAAAQQYPFRGRLMGYLIPGLLLSVAAGADAIRRGIGRLQPAAGAPAMLLLLAPPVAALAGAPPPYDIEHHRTMLGYLARHRQPGDVVCVFPVIRIGVLHYGPRFGLGPGDWVTAVCDRNDTRAYLRDVDRFRGLPRVWVLSSAPRPFRVARPAVRRYLSAIGIRRDSLVRRSLQFESVSLELYDLSDPVRLRAATAETFPVPPMPTDPRPGCRPWARPSPLDSLGSRWPPGLTAPALGPRTR